MLGKDMDSTSEELNQVEAAMVRDALSYYQGVEKICGRSGNHYSFPQKAIRHPATNPSHDFCRKGTMRNRSRFVPL